MNKHNHFLDNNKLIAVLKPYGLTTKRRYYERFTF